jgi:hypothetical protein
MTTKTTAKTADQITIGDRIKFGKDDFRTVTAIEHKWGGIYATVDGGTMTEFDLTQRKNRVAA